MEHLSGHYEIMQAVHELLDGRLPVIPMTIQDVDIIRAQPLEGVCYVQPLRFGSVSCVVDPLRDGFVMVF